MPLHAPRARLLGIIRDFALLCYGGGPQHGGKSDCLIHLKFAKTKPRGSLHSGSRTMVSAGTASARAGTGHGGEGASDLCPFVVGSVLLFRQKRDHEELGDPELSSPTHGSTTGLDGILYRWQILTPTN